MVPLSPSAHGFAVSFFVFWRDFTSHSMLPSVPKNKSGDGCLDYTNIGDLDFSFIQNNGLLTT